MKNVLQKQLDSYHAFHQNKINRMMHLFGIPTVVFSIFIGLGWISLAPVLFAVGIIYYLWLDLVTGVAATVVLIPILLAAMQVSALPFNESLIWFIASTVLGWILQLGGHVFEGKRPAFLSNIVQLLNGPLFFVTEILSFLGVHRAAKPAKR
jgi:uncharacterized membrane protein YGL010W